MEPPNGVAAVFFGYMLSNEQVTTIVLAMLELVVFCQIIYPRFCLFLKPHRPRDGRDLQQVKMISLNVVSVNNKALNMIGCYQSLFMA